MLKRSVQQEIVSVMRGGGRGRVFFFFRCSFSAASRFSPSKVGLVTSMKIRAFSTKQEKSRLYTTHYCIAIHCIDSLAQYTK